MFKQNSLKSKKSLQIHRFIFFLEENCFKLPNDAYYSLKVGNRDDLNPKMKDTARIEIKMKTNLIEYHADIINRQNNDTSLLVLSLNYTFL